MTTLSNADLIHRGMVTAVYAAEAPDRLAVISEAGSRTFAELNARANQVLRALWSRGVQPGSTIALVCSNRPEFVEVYEAVLRGGMRLTAINWHLTADEITYIVEDSEAAALIGDSRFADVLASVGAAVSHPIVKLAVGDSIDGFSSYEDAVAAEASDDIDDPWPGTTMLYTSGTTGRPKGVVHGGLTPDGMATAQRGLAALWGFRKDDVHLLAGPAYHAGPGGYAFTTLFTGGTVAILRAWDARAALAEIDRHRVTTSFLTPAHFIRILEVAEGERAGYDLSSLRLVIHGGAPCPPTVKWRIIEALPATEVWELYGASEGGATRVSPDEWRTRPGTVGRPWPGVEVRVVDGDGKPVETGQEGVIYIKPAGGATFHYHRDEAKTANAWRDGAFTVGDVGRLDDDGYLYITDRVSDMVIRDGVNVYPREIEDVLHLHPEVVDCAVFGIEDDRRGEVIVAVVEARSPVSADELAAHVRSNLADFKCPERFTFVDELPRDPNGKVLKRLLRETSKSPAGRSGSDDVSNLIQRSQLRGVQ